MCKKLELTNEIDIVVDKLLNMDPDPIPYFILLKEFKKINPQENIYRDAYEKLLEHKFVKELEATQTEFGYWGEFHGETEEAIRRCITIGLDNTHPCLTKACSFIERILRKEDIWHQRCEKHDNPKWWLDMFMPLVSAAMLSLVDPNNKLLSKPLELWSSFTEEAFKDGCYNPIIEKETQDKYFNIKTKRTLPFHNYYTILLLTSTKNNISSTLGKNIIHNFMQKADGMYYIYDKSPKNFIPIHDTRNFYKWVRLLTIYNRFKSWDSHKYPFYEWIWTQRNDDGLWDIIKKPKSFCFPLSNSWRSKKNRIIDSSIYVLRLLSNYQGF